MSVNNCKDCQKWDSKDFTCLVQQIEYDEPVADNDFKVFIKDVPNYTGYIGLKTGPLFGCHRFSSHNKIRVESLVDSSPEHL